ncbi:MAG TPA: hypothetical protein ENJ09_11570 [Planctomycetes bacterium]|nr:hypothetical protein [Planctomycetota bacterium]
MRDHGDRRGDSERRSRAGAGRVVARCAVGVLLGWLALFVAACGSEDGAFELDPFTLHRNLYASGRFELVAPEGPLLERARSLAGFLESATGFRCRVHAPGAEPPDPGAVRLVFGLVDDGRIQRLAAPLGLSVEPGGFRILGRLHEGPGDRFVAAFADPGRTGLPIVLWAGRDEEALARSIADVPAPWRPRLTSVRNGAAGIETQLTLDGRPAARAPLDHAEAREARTAAGADRILEGRGFRLHVPPDVSLARAAVYRRTVNEAVARVTRWIGAKPPDPKIEVILHGSSESMFAELGVVRLSLCDPISGRVDVLLTPGLDGDGGAAPAECAARNALGDPAVPWLARAIGIAAADAWWSRPLTQWCARLQWAGLLRDPARILGEAGERVEEHVREPARGLFVARLCRRPKGRRELLSLWRGEAALSIPESLFSKRELDAFKPRLRRERGRHRAHALPRSLWGGSAGEPDDARIGRGGVLLALDGELPIPDLPSILSTSHRLGADLVAVTVQASRTAHAAALGPRADLFRTSPDAEVAEVLARAAAVGMRTVLCAEPLASPAGTWGHGDKLVDPESTRRFFNGFRRVATHYALLAELLDIDILSVGSGLTRASRTAPDAKDSAWLAGAKRERLAGWRALLASVRPLFDGAITYAADGMGELSGIGFFGELDLVGFWAFPSFESEDSPDSGTVKDSRIRYRLRRSLTEVRAFGDEVRKPVLVLGMGFPARAGSLGQPAVPAGPVDEKLQDRLYLGLSEAMRVTPEEELPQGIVLWNFGSDLSVDETGYSPLGRTAEKRLPHILRGTWWK